MSNREASEDLRLLTADEVADILMVTRPTLKKILDEERLGRKVGGQWRIPLADVKAYMKGELRPAG